MNSALKNEFLTGVVEGFYGREWPWETRLAYGDYLQALGLNTYLYCPKADHCLRRQWQHAWPAGQFRQLQLAAEHYHQRNLIFGIGLSPFALYENYGPAQRQQLKGKVDEICSLGVPLLAILFDDMPGNLDALAARQADIVSDVCDWARDCRIQVCPTYYSFDPVLETHFGKRPDNYWQQLGQELPAGVDIYWTGNKVCSEAIGAADIVAIEELLSRPVMLWDNYPVNDGAVRSKRLYCQPLAHREDSLRPLLSGHLCNPMNQGVLSLPALTGLAVLHGGTDPGEPWLEQMLGMQTRQLLVQHQKQFQEGGLDSLKDSERKALAASFGANPGPAAAEVAGWLRGEYTFDPACLTD